MTGAAHDLADQRPLRPDRGWVPSVGHFADGAEPAAARPRRAADGFGDVVRLCQQGKLTSDTFRYLGPRRRSEIEAGLVLAGFDISHRVCDGEPGCTQR